MKKFFSLQRFSKKVNLTKKDDTYSNTAENVVVKALAGNDSISNSGNYVTVSGGADNDTIRNNGSHVSLAGDAGNDYISYYTSYYSSVVSSSGYYVTLSGGTGNDTIYSTGNIAKVDGGTGDDSIRSTGNDATVSGGKGNDTIYNSGGYDSSIDGGAGNDYIYSSHHYSYSSSVSSNSYYTTLSGGKGNDIIQIEGENHKNTLKYASGDGNDIVLGFNSDDTLHITKGNYSVKTDENDVIVTVGKGKITLKGAAGQKLSITNSKGKTKTKTYGSAALFTENNFVENELDSIIENKSPVVPEEFKISEATNLAAKTSLTSGVDYDKN